METRKTDKYKVRLTFDILDDNSPMLGVSAYDVESGDGIGWCEATFELHDSLFFDWDDDKVNEWVEETFY